MQLKGFEVGKLLLVIVGVLLFAAVLMALVKGVLIFAAIVISLMLLARLYQVRPKAFYALCITAAAAFLPKTLWPWVGITVMVWLAIEFVHATYTRLRRPAMPRLPSA